MAFPTIKNPSIKYIGKTRKGLPVKMWCKTYFEYNERTHEWTQRQEWSETKPEVNNESAD